MGTPGCRLFERESQTLDLHAGSAVDAPTGPSRREQDVEIVYERVAGIDVGKKIIAVVVRTPGERPGKRRQQLRQYATFHQTLTQMVAWLVAEGVTHVTMEATGIYWKPIFHALCAAERPLEVLWVNARHVKNVPGRTSDALDAAWLAELTECGLLRGGSSHHPRSARSAS